MAESVSQRLLFRDEEDFHGYLNALEQKVREAHLTIYAFYLQKNTLRLVLEPKRRELGPLMQSLHGQHTRRMNRKYRETGRLFAGRFRSILFPPDQLAEVVRDVHLYPIRTGQFRQASSPKFSSHRTYVDNDAQWHHLITTGPLLAQFSTSPPVAQKAFKRFVEAAVLEPDLSGIREVTPGVYLPEDLVDFFELKNKKAPSTSPPTVSLETLIEEVCLLFQIQREILTGPSQKSRWVMARRLLVTSAITSAGHQQSDVARALQRHKSQISRLLNQGEDALKNDDVFKELYFTLAAREENL